MALSTLAKEQENFLRYAILIVDHSKEALQDLVELNLKNKHLTFHEFLNQNQHEIYHLCYDARCCQCQNTPPRRKRIIFPPQLELLFDKYKKLPSHTAIGHNDFCCSYAKVGITSQVLDLSLTRCLLVNCCLDVFWSTCLTSPDQTLEQFLNSNKHIIYHLWKNNQNCCQCTPGYIFPCDSSIVTEKEWKSMFSSRWSPCENDRKRMPTGSSSVCSVGATSGIDTKDINPEIQRYIIQKCSHISKAVDFLVEQRNLRFAHVPEAKISDRDFKLFLTDIETHLLGIARVCGKETHVKKNLRDLHLKPLSINMLSKYTKLLHKSMEAVNKNVISEHQKTRKNVSYKIRKLENRIESLETSSMEIREEVQGLQKLITDRSKRSQLIRETIAEIDNHRKDQTYTEIKAVTACVQMLDNSKVLILSGREGSGKSRNSLEILRQVKEKHPETDVIKLKRLPQFTDIIDKNAMTIVLFEDIFGRTRKQFCEDTDVQILDSLHSYISLGNVKVIFVMRNNVKQECQSLLSSHEIFCNSIAYLDLNSEEFGLSLKEKERLFINYCTKNEIDIVYKENFSYRNDNVTSIDKITVSIIDKPDFSCRLSADNKCLVINSWAIEDIIRSDPYQGFPECCRLFTMNKNITILGATYFRYPLKSLLKEIEDMRMEGKANDVKGLKYVILLYILLNQTPSAGSLQTDSHDRVMLSINENDIDVLAHQTLFNECYNKNTGLRVHDIMYLYEELTCRYLTRKENKIYFQHQALQDSVLISYGRVNPKAIIPQLSVDHMIYIVRPQSYVEQEDEIVIKISKTYYYELAKKIISLIDSISYNDSKRDRFTESKIITDNDVDLIYQLIVCRNNGNYKLSSLPAVCLGSYAYHYFPLYLLRNIGKLNDKMITVNHSKYHMLISVTIGDKNTCLRIDPNSGLLCALQSKHEDILKWLLKNTNHLLLNFGCILVDPIRADRAFEHVKLLLENVNHEIIDMTDLLSNARIVDGTHVQDWIMDNVDNSLIDYTKCIEYMIDYANTNLIPHILKKVDDHRLLNINEVVKVCCNHGCSEVVKWLLENVDHKLFDEEELLNITINVYEEKDDDDCFVSSKIVELLLFQKPRISCCNTKKLFDMANRKRWYCVLELLFEQDSNDLINTDQVLEDMLKQWGDEEQDYMPDVYKEVYFNAQHCGEIINIMINYGNHVNVNKIIENAITVGLPEIVEELLCDETTSHYLDITLDKLKYLHLNRYCINDGHAKILLLLLQKVNTKYIKLNSVMNDVCHIGHSSSIIWLLEKQPAHPFEIRKVMNKACFHGDLELVEYLKQKYKAGDFDYKTAMIKACRHTQCNTLDVCKWLWENIDRSVFDMKASLNNAIKCDNTKVVKWILTDVDKGLYDTESALLYACENGEDNTVELLLDKSSINMIIMQYAITIACRNEDNGLSITELLYEHADQTTIDINFVLSNACKNYKTDIIQWIIETCDQNIIVTETNDRKKHYINSRHKTRLNMDQAVTCILDMDAPEQQKNYVNENKKQLLELILTKTDPSIINIYKLLTESCKNDWVEIFQLILEKVDHACLNIGEIINVACRNGAFYIIEWSLTNIDIQLVDVDNVMVESCGFGWLECLVLIFKHCNKYKLQAAMTEACTYGRLHIAEWLLRNVHYHFFNIPMLLQQAGRNGWINIFRSLLKQFIFDKSDMYIATSQALENGHLEIAELGITKFDKEGFDFSSLSENAYAGANKEAVVNFLLHNIDHRSIDIATIMTNACLFGWKDVATFIVDNDLTSLCDLSLGFNTACDNGELEIVQLLLDKVDSHILTTVDKAMHSVAVKGWDEIALLLLDKVEHPRLDIGNALIKACRHGEIDVVQAILRKVDSNMLDVKTAINKACENHMHEELVLWILENIDREQVDLKTVKSQTIRHKWRKIQYAILEVDTEDLNKGEQQTETDFIVIS